MGRHCGRPKARSQLRQWHDAVTHITRNTSVSDENPKPQKCIRLQEAMVSNQNPKSQINLLSKNLTCNFNAFRQRTFHCDFVYHRRELLSCGWDWMCNNNGIWVNAAKILINGNLRNGSLSPWGRKALEEVIKKQVKENSIFLRKPLFFNFSLTCAVSHFLTHKIHLIYVTSLSQKICNYLLCQTIVSFFFFYNRVGWSGIF